MFLGLTLHTPIRARRLDGYIKLPAAAGPILCDAMPSGLHFADQDPARFPSAAENQPLTKKPASLFRLRLLP